MMNRNRCVLSVLLSAPLAAQVAADPSRALTWDDVAARLEREASAGFAGAVLLVRDGRVVLDRGYGFADREQEIANAPDTIFAIGSTPIDFTKAGILWLAERGKLQLGDPITAFFDDVPADKRPITIEQLMTGGSGLRDFHDLPADRDPDHGWIERAEAVRRILGQKLLFAPGHGREHSHSAWVLLAAILEIASDQSYQEFTRAHLFGPAGMKDTGFFGEPLPAARVAIGYGERRDGDVNAPPFWGPTSWLVMGSGGMVSTTGDLLRWNRALRSGRLLQPESLQRYWSPPGGLLAGGDMYGFEILYTEGPRSLMILVSNAQTDATRPAMQRLGRDLAALVNADARPDYTLGIEMAVEGEGRVVLRRVLPDSAAARDGLRAGDVLVAVAGKATGDEVAALLAPYLRTGKPVPFTVERDGAELEVVVTPNPRPAATSGR